MPGIMTPQEALPKIRAILEAGGSCPITVTGTSMTPLLRQYKDVVLLSPLTGPVKKGDILFHVRENGRCILHRVIRVCPDGALDICGDAQTRPERVQPRQVVGIVTRIRRNGREFPVTALPWRIASGLWMGLRPLRPRLLKLIGALAQRKQAFRNKTAKKR